MFNTFNTKYDPLAGRPIEQPELRQRNIILVFGAVAIVMAISLIGLCCHVCGCCKCCRCCEEDDRNKRHYHHYRNRAERRPKISHIRMVDGNISDKSRSVHVSNPYSRLVDVDPSHMSRVVDLSNPGSLKTTASSHYNPMLYPITPYNSRILNANPSYMSRVIHPKVFQKSRMVDANTSCSGLMDANPPDVGWKDANTTQADANTTQADANCSRLSITGQYAHYL